MRHLRAILLATFLLLITHAVQAEDELILPDVAPPDAFEGAAGKVAGTWWSLLWTDELTHPVLSANGSSVACAMRKGDKWAVMKDGKVYGGEYDSIGPVVLSADGKQMAFQARRGTKFYIIWNGRESVPYMACTTPAFSPVDGEMAFLAHTKGKFVLFRNGRAVYRKGYDMVHTPVYSSRGSIAFWATYAGHQFVVRDGVRVGGVFPRVTEPVFSLSGAVYFGATTENSLVITCEGQAVGTPVKYRPGGNEVGFVALKTSPVSESVAYSMLFDASGPQLYRDGRAIRDSISGAGIFTFDGDSMYYPCRTADAVFIAKDGVPATETHPKMEVSELTVNHGGTSIAFAARNDAGKMAVYLNNKQIGKEYDAVKSVFLADDSSVYYFAKTAKGWTLVKNGTATESAYSFVTDFVRTGARSCVFAATNGKEVIRKEMSW